MSTSYDPVPSTRGSLRLHMSDRIGLDTLDGGWWPRSRDLAVELADLAGHFPRAFGRIRHAVYSPPDWDEPPRRIAVRDGHVEVDAVAQDDTHLVLLRTSQRLTLRLLVVPHDFSADQGAEALLAATTSGYAHSAGCLLDTVADQPGVEPLDFWV